MSSYSLWFGFFDAGRTPGDEAPPPLLTRPHVQVSGGNLDDSSIFTPSETPLRKMVVGDYYFGRPAPIHQKEPDLLEYVASGRKLSRRAVPMIVSRPRA